MRIVMFYHSLLSDWNHGNAHFLRGVVSELLSRGHEAVVYEPMDSWSLRNLLTGHGFKPVEELLRKFPWIKSRRYDPEDFDPSHALEGADLVIVHEWNSHDLVRRIGEARRYNPGFKLLFHDTHHRSISEPQAMAAYDLSHYDGVLVFGEALRDIYRSRGWAENVWTWHEAADTRVFQPLKAEKDKDVVWIGNWGDGERTAEIREFFLEPVKELGLKAGAHGVRYPEDAVSTLDEAGVEYGGWIPNYSVPHAFARSRSTVHVPRRPYAEALPGIPTIRVFEALACGIPLVSAPWEDSEGLFTAGKDFLFAGNGREMKKTMKELLHDSAMRKELSEHGRETILKRHTCAHRVDELMTIYSGLSGQRRRWANA